MPTLTRTGLLAAFTVVVDSTLVTCAWVLLRHTVVETLASGSKPQWWLGWRIAHTHLQLPHLD